MSNLLDKASIILTPTAYNNGEALCVKPSDGSGDFDFSRNSAATRVNAQGLVENVQSLSSNLITNGDFATDSDWQLTQATISNGEATFATTDGSFAGIRQNVFTIGKTYLISIEVSNLVGTAEVNTNGGTSIGLDITSVGTKSFYMVAENTDIEIKRKFGITNVSATIDNVSVREAIDNTNLPRINYEGFSYDGSGNVVPDSGCGSWLFEPQSTNLIPYSEEITQFDQNNVTTLNNQTISADGTQNASKVTKLGVSANDRLKEDISISSATSYNVSVFLKNDTIDGTTTLGIRISGGTLFRLGFDWNGSTPSISAIYSSGTRTNEIIENYGNGWYRVGYSFVSDGTNADFELDLDRDNGSDTTSLFVWGAMLEAQSYATSYIPTDGSTVTRNQDVCTNGGSLASINSTSGTLYFEGSALVETDTTNRHLSISDGSNNNRLYFYYTTSGRFGFAAFVGGVLQVAITYDGVLLNNSKVACKYKENDYALWVNGVEVATDTNASVWSSGTLDRINFAEPNSVSSPFFGKTKAVAVWKEALSDQELAELTTI